VGYGDITPHTNLGKTVASFMMLLGWGILAVPTGIVTAEMSLRRGDRRGGPPRVPGQPRQCGACGSGGHEATARYCKDCGASLQVRT
jgi:voltage-gated potassium channel